MGRKSPIKKIPSLRCADLKSRCGLNVVEVGEGQRRRRGDVSEQMETKERRSIFYFVKEDITISNVLCLIRVCT